MREVQPSLRDSCSHVARLPGTSVPGYFHASLWDSSLHLSWVPGTGVPGYCQSSLRDSVASAAHLPGTDVPGYSQASLRDSGNGCDGTEATKGKAAKASILLRGTER